MTTRLLILRICALVAVVGTLLGGEVAISGTVQRTIYPAPTQPLSLVGLPPGTRMIEATTADGLTLKGLAVSPRNGRPVLLVFHGNGSSAGDTVTWFAPLIEQDYGLVAAEYRGYSGNPRSPSEEGLGRDADAFSKVAKAEAPSTSIWLVGHSLGSGVALGLAQRQRLDVVVTIGAFTRLRAMAPKIVRALVPDAYRNTEALTKIVGPYFLIHGTRDDVVPIAEGEKLHEAAGDAKLKGASFVLDANHYPKATALGSIFETIATYSATAKLSAQILPASIKLIPFGQRTPINP